MHKYKTKNDGFCQIDTLIETSRYPIRLPIAWLKWFLLGLDRLLPTAITLYMLNSFRFFSEMLEIMSE
jgi:hypothetical protein